MRDKDIKNIINKASVNEEYSVSSEDIRNALMERIGKRCNEQSAGEGNVVSPIIVTAHKKNSFVKIAAGVTAASLGIVIIGAVAYHNGFDLDRLTTFDPTNISEISTSPTASGDNSVSSNTGKKETLTFEEIQIPVEGTYDHSANKNPGDFEITLLDGTVVKYHNNDTDFTDSIDSDLPIIKECDKLYFVGDGNKRDITDQMSADEYFCVSYAHPKTGLKHYLIAGGDLKAKFFGYIELFWLPGDTRAYTVYRFFTEGMNDYGDGSYDPLNAPNKDWLDNTLKKISDTLKEKYGTSILIEGCQSFTDYPTFPDKILK